MMRTAVHTAHRQTAVTTHSVRIELRLEILQDTVSRCVNLKALKACLMTLKRSLIIFKCQL